MTLCILLCFHYNYSCIQRTISSAEVYYGIFMIFHILLMMWICHILGDWMLLFYVILSNLWHKNILLCRLCNFSLVSSIVLDYNSTPPFKRKRGWLKYWFIPFWLYCRVHFLTRLLLRRLQDRQWSVTRLVTWKCIGAVLGDLKEIKSAASLCLFPCLQIKQHAFPIQLSKQKQNVPLARSGVVYKSLTGSRDTMQGVWRW